MRLKHLLVLLPVLLITSCNNQENNQNPPIIEEIKEYTVTFDTHGGSKITNQKIKENESLNEPNEPTKKDYLFDGWYLDNSYTNLVSFPLLINDDITIHAKWIDAKSYFFIARENTLGKDYEFESTLAMKVGVTLTSQTLNGTDKTHVIKKESSDVKYLSDSINSGSLFYDGRQVEYVKSDKVTSIKTNEDEIVTSFKNEQLTSDYKYGASSYSKLLFDYSENDIKSVSESNNKYEIISKEGFSSIASKILSNVNNPIVEIIIGELPETESSFHTYVTFNKDKTLKTYEYAFDVQVSVGTVSLNYKINFNSPKDVGNPVLPKFDGLSLVQDDISNYLNEINTAIDTYKGETTSSYDYKFDTTITLNKKDLGTTVKGSTKRKIDVDSKEVYYWNKTELDTDLKDIYEIKDYVRTRAKLLDETVYDMENPLIGTKKYTKVESPLNSDNFYYLLPINYVSSGYNYIQKITKDNETTYSLGLNDNELESTLIAFAEYTRLDVSLKNEYDVFGEFISQSLITTSKEVVIKLVDEKINEISVSLNGKINTSYLNTTYNGEGDIKLDYSFKTNNDGDDYTIPTKTSEIE